MWQIFLKYNFQSSYRIETWALAVKFLSGEPHHWEINIGYIIIWSHYLSQCWPICMPPYCVTRPQCVEMSEVVEIHPQGNQPFLWLVAVDGSRPLPGGRFKNTYELLNLRALKFSYVNKIHIFQCTGKIFCVEFQRYPLKFHTKNLTHTLKDMIFIQHWKFKSS